MTDSENDASQELIASVIARRKETDDLVKYGAAKERLRIAAAIVAWAESPVTMEKRPELWEAPGLLGAVLRDLEEILDHDLESGRLSDEAIANYDLTHEMERRDFRAATRGLTREQIADVFDDLLGEGDSADDA